MTHVTSLPFLYVTYQKVHEFKGRPQFTVTLTGIELFQNGTNTRYCTQLGQVGDLDCGVETSQFDDRGKARARARMGAWEHKYMYSTTTSVPTQDQIEVVQLLMGSLCLFKPRDEKLYELQKKQPTLPNFYFSSFQKTLFFITLCLWRHQDPLLRLQSLLSEPKVKPSSLRGQTGILSIIF